MKKFPLPPYGKLFSRPQKSGIRVAVGPRAYDKADAHAFPIMVLPQDRSPREYRWPSDNGPALIFECGECNDESLDALAQALLRAGASSVVAIREALLDDGDPRVFYDAEVFDVAA